MKPIHTTKYLVIGGGPCGIGAALRLQREKQDWFLIERDNVFGGLAGSFVDDNGFTWDYGGHVLFSHYQTFDDYMKEALGDEWFDHERESWVWIKDRFVPYPFQNNLHRLDPEDRWKCVKGLLDIIQYPSNDKPKNFNKWMHSIMGQGITDLFMAPYNFKVWAYPPDDMDYNWIGERVAVPPLEKVLHSVCTGVDNASWGPNNLFRFPQVGGTGEIWRTLGNSLPKDQCALNTEIVNIDVEKKLATDAAGNTYQYESLITTLPLDRLIRIAPGVVKEEMADTLKFSASHIVGIGMTGQPPEHLDTKCWMYFPENNSPYYRTTVFSNYSKNNVPKPGEQWSLMTEISESPVKPVDQTTLIDEVVRAFKEDQLITEQDEIITKTACRVPYGYPTPFLGRDKVVDPALRSYEQKDIYSRGRFGAWKYEVANMDHSFAQGYECVNRLVHNGGAKEEPTLFTPNVVNSQRNP